MVVEFQGRSGPLKKRAPGPCKSNMAAVWASRSPEHVWVRRSTRRRPGKLLDCGTSFFLGGLGRETYPKKHMGKYRILVVTVRSRWWFQIIFSIFILIPGEMFRIDTYFFNWVVQPPASFLVTTNGAGFFPKSQVLSGDLFWVVCSWPFQGWKRALGYQKGHLEEAGLKV